MNLIDRTKQATAKARHKRRIILRHKRRMRYLRIQNSNHHKSNTTLGQPISSTARNQTPLADITSSINNISNSERRYNHYIYINIDF
jgi:hypothetical protein